MSVGKRKYSYLIYEDGTKERILNWFNASFDTRPRHRKIIAFTQNGTYLYVDDDWELPSQMYNPPVFKRPHAFYKLRSGVHNIEVDNKDIWYHIDNIDRMEIMMDLN